LKVKIPTLSHKSREGRGTLSICLLGFCTFDIYTDLGDVSFKTIFVVLVLSVCLAGCGSGPDFIKQCNYSQRAGGKIPLLGKSKPWLSRVVLGRSASPSRDSRRRLSPHEFVRESS